MAATHARCCVSWEAVVSFECGALAGLSSDSARVRRQRCRSIRGSRQGAATRLHQNEAKTKNAPSSNAQMRRAQKMRRMYANEMCMSNHGAMIVPPGPATPSLGSVRSDNCTSIKPYYTTSLKSRLSELSPQISTLDRTHARNRNAKDTETKPNALQGERGRQSTDGVWR
jgi:hypothetical protein